MVRKFLACAMVVAMAGVATGDAIKLGDKAPDFTNLDSTSDKAVSLADFKRDALVICITCNHCPAAVAMEDRLVKFAEKHCGSDGKCDLVAINVNNLEPDKLPAMKERAKEKGFNFTYAYDPSQEIALALGAKKTPTFFVFDKDRKLVYTGLFDDNVMKEDEAKVNYVEQAVQAVVSGGKAPESTKPQGCGIKFDK